MKNDDNNKSYSSYKNTDEYTRRSGNLKLVENKKEVSKENKAHKKFIGVIAVILIAMIAVFIGVNREYLSSGSFLQWVKSDFLGIDQGSGYPKEIVGNSVEKNNIDMLGRYFSYISDTTFTSLNTTAGEILSAQHSFASPAMSCSKSSALYYDIGGTAYCIEGIDTESYKGTSQEKIYCASISDSGAYGIVSETNGYFSNITIYNKDSEFIYSYKMSEYYVMDICMDSSGNYCAVSGVSTKDGALISAVYVLDFTAEKPYAVFKFSENLISDVEYLSNGNIACIGDLGAYVLDPDNEDVKEYDYQGKALTYGRIRSDYGIVLSISPSEDSKECMLVLIDNDGDLQCEINTGEAIKCIDVYDDTLTALTKGSIKSYSDDGTLMAETKCNKDAKSFLMSNEYTVYILGVSMIYCVDISG